MALLSSAEKTQLRELQAISDSGGVLTPIQQEEQERLLHRIESGEAAYLRSAGEQTQRHLESAAEQNQRLTELAERKAALVSRLQHFVASFESEQQIIDEEVGRLLHGPETTRQTTLSR